jgi:hypothetical protein
MADSAITFTSGEVSTYYAARCPHLNQKGAAEWRGACPIHRGKHDSFAVDPATGRWFCHSACGRGGDIFDIEEALTGKDFPTRKTEVFRLVGRIEAEYRHNGTRTNGNQADSEPPKPTKPNGTWREITRYPYSDQDGTLLYEVVRYLKPDGTKTFIQVRPSGVEVAGTTDPKRSGVVPGGIVVGLDAGKYLLDPKATRKSGRTTWRRVEDQGADYDGAEYTFRACPRVPYRLPKLLKAETVYLPEGENDVHTLEGWGLVGSCNPGGCGGTHLYADWIGIFAGKRIVIPFDNDDAGRKHAAAKVATLLPVAASVRVVELPGLPEKGDVTDWRDAGGTLDQFRELTEAAAILDAAALSELRVRWGLPDEKPQHQAALAKVADDWPDPIPFLCRNTPALPADVLPGFLGDMVSATARATETPVEMAALLGLAVVAASVAKKVIVSPESGYSEPVNLYTAVGMESGNRKTAVLSSMTRPFVKWEETESCRLKPEITRITSERKTKEMAIEALRKEAARKPYDSSLIAEITEMESSLPEVPTAPRLWTQDITPERLGSLMAEQGERMALFSDEGGIFDTLAGRYNKGVPNLDLFLQAHAGAPVRVDRGSRPPVMLYRPALTLALAPQPDVLATLSDKPGFRGRGLLARILYGLPLSPIGFRKLNACPCSPTIEAAYSAGIERLLRLTPPTDEDAQWQPWRLTFDPNAYSSWKDFQRSIEILMREGNKLYCLKDWGSKLAGAAARIAGVLHCVTVDPTASTIITEDTVDGTLNLLMVIMDHTLAVFDLMERDKNVEDARKILEWIQKQGESSFTVRGCYCAHQTRFKVVDAIRLPLSLLEQHYCIRPCPKPQVSHRPSEGYNVNPKLLGAS